MGSRSDGPEHEARLLFGWGWSIQADAGSILVRALPSADLTNGFISAVCAAMVHAAGRSSHGSRTHVRLLSTAQDRQSCRALHELSRQTILAESLRFDAQELKPSRSTPAWDPELRLAEAHYVVMAAA